MFLASSGHITAKKKTRKREKVESKVNLKKVYKKTITYLIKKLKAQTTNCKAKKNSASRDTRCLVIQKSDQ